MWRWTFGVFLILVVAPAGAANFQCNLGHKVFSVENGNTVCAPLAPHQCVHSCEWNTSCSNTAHSHAFHGRRTFVAGMILMTDNFLLLCCATFANVVQQNQKLENRCVWVPPTNTIENGASVRFDPPLNMNEFVRDVQMKRLERGRVELLQTMPEEDKQPYSLLALRLSRAEQFLKEHNGTDPRAFFSLPDVPAQDQFRDEVSASSTAGELRGLAGGLKPTAAPVRQVAPNAPLAPPRPQAPQQVRADLPLRSQKNGPNSVLGAQGFRQVIRPSQRNGGEEANSPHANPLTSPHFDTTALDAPFAHRLGSPRQVQPVRAASFDADGTSLPAVVWARRIRPAAPHVLTVAANRWAAISPRSIARHRHTHLAAEEHDGEAAGGRRIHAVATSRLGSSTLHSGESAERTPPLAHATSTAFGERGGRDDDDRSDAFFSLSAAPAPPPTNPGPRYVLATNQTQEVAHKYRRMFARDWQTAARTGGQSEAASRLAALRRSLVFAKPPARFHSAANDEEIDERPMKSALAIRKLRLGDATTSFGGSFAPAAVAPVEAPIAAAPTARTLPTFTGERQHEEDGAEQRNALAALEFVHQTANAERTEGLRLPHGVVFAPAQRTIQHSFGDGGADRVTLHNGARPAAVAPVAPPSLPAHSPRLPVGQPIEPVRSEPPPNLRQLLDCCQQQAPGCRHLCSPNVSKEEIKRAIQTNQCPPLSMTSVLQCFPRFYDISSVGQCCEVAAAAPRSSAPAPSSFLSPPSSPPRLPGQCQSLCAPNFKLSFSHFACVDHISTIVDCYRDLLLR
ncbi:hypothetical protein M3Y99_01273600 [Aphelenchoides fujianensis]|nr:hypothetical protein M3Y99_01273600 [Aphelenchoides fujianensis]